jgi:alpha-tubulin suppressor-like RCC1 family protein
VAADGAAYCWGFSGAGQLGTGTVIGSTSPVAVSGGLRFVAIEAGFDFTCGLTVAGQAYCWGNNLHGQLGDGTTFGRLTPVPAAGALRFVELAAGSAHTCGRLANGEVQCWGSNQFGQLGDGSRGADALTPTRVTGGHRFDRIDSALWESCGVAAGAVLCWGIIYPNIQEIRTSPTPVGVPGAVASVSVGVVHDCALTVSGAAFCWGTGVADLGMLGNGSAAGSPTPVEVAGGHVFSVIETPNANNIYAAHTCGLDASGVAFCWGNSDWSQLGTVAADTCINPSIGSVACSVVPIAVAGLRFTAVALAGRSTCGLAGSGDAYCWGSNLFGILGTGVLEDRATPARVAPVVSAPTVARIELSPSDITIGNTDTTNISAVARDAGGTQLPVPFEWTSSDTTVVTFVKGASVRWPVTPGPVSAIAITPGTAFVRASVGGIVDSVRVVVQ